VRYDYDPIGQLTNAVGKEAGATTNRLQEQLAYGYDAAHNLSARTNNGLVQTFGVNSLNELSTITRSGTFTVAGTTTSSATGVTVNGNSATLYSDKTFAKASVSLSDGNNTFTAIASDALGRSDTNAVTAYLPATNVFVYDSNGNMTSDGKRGFDYDDENQLIRITATNAWKSEFTYDGKMRMRIRKEYVWNITWLLSSETHYIYDGNLIIQERDQYSTPRVTYTRAGGLLARTDSSTLVVSPGTAHAYYHADGNGNITALTSSQQIIVAKYLYEPFGRTLSQSGPLADVNYYRFSSKEYHVNSGLYYFGRRFYEPQLQRWINRDPLEEKGGGNLYGYVRNNPISLSDDLGMCDDAWYDDLAKWAKQRIAEDKAVSMWLAGDFPWWMNGFSDTYSDVVYGLLTIPSAIGHAGEATGRTGWYIDEPILQPVVTMGTGSGTFAGNPTLANFPGVLMDFSTGVLIATPVVGTLSFAKIPLFGSGAPALPVAQAAAESGASSSLQGNLLRQQLAAEEAAGAQLPQSVTGYTTHGLNQAISREGVGVSPSAILDAWKSPSVIEGGVDQAGRPYFNLTGGSATISVNPQGQIITTWPTISAGFRGP
jgi:RHS repeat-associated protein